MFKKENGILTLNDVVFAKVNIFFSFLIFFYLLFSEIFPFIIIDPISDNIGLNRFIISEESSPLSFLVKSLVSLINLLEKPFACSLVILGI